MRLAGIITEYDPFHAGHAWQLRRARELGAEAIAVCMSEDLTQRGSAALLPVAVLAQGVGSETFGGYYDNTDVYNKLAALLEIQ